jgi:serine/threonine protein phosphatase PrpC
MRAFGESIVGRRDNNEDSFRVCDDLGLFLVADGMGGHDGGEVASRVVADTVTRCFQTPPTNPAMSLDEAYETPTQPTATAFLDAATRTERSRRGSGPVATRKHLELDKKLDRAIRLAQHEIETLATGDRDLHEMGTTLAALFIEDAFAVVAHVGDSRVYRLRGGELEQLTEDHSFVSELRAAGAWAILEHTTPQMAAMVTRCLAPNANYEPDIEIHPVEPGDVFLLCSDGLSDVLHPRHIGAVLRDFEDPQEASKELVRQAYRVGSQDNITALVVHA